MPNWKTPSNDSWTDPAAWDTGVVPGLTDSSAIAVAGGYRVSLTASISTGSLAISDTGAALVTVNPGGLEAFSGDLANAGFLGLDSDSYSNEGGSTVSIASTLTNTGQVAVGLGGGTLSARTRLTVGALVNTGSVSVYGAAAAAGPLAELDVLSAAPATLAGNVTLQDDALLDYASGQIATIAGGATLLLNGPRAFIADAGNTAANSAIAGLTEIDGTLRVINGSTVAITGNVTETGVLGLDSDDYNNEGGSVVSIAGVLTNTGAVSVGSGTNNLDAAATLTVGGLTGTGSVGVNGSYAATPSLAMLDVLSAAPGTLSASTTLDGDALLEYASGQIATISANTTLLLNGPKAFIADAGNTAANSAIAGLTEIDGTLRVINGSTVAITGNVTDTGFLGLDSDDYNNEGGSSVIFAGTLTNTGQLVVGSDTNNLTTNDALTVGALAGMGSVRINGSFATAPIQASLIVRSAAPGTLVANTTLSGASLLQYTSGQIGTIASGVTLFLNGSRAIVADAGNTATNSALAGLTEVDGALRVIDGDSIAIAGNLTETGFLGLDSDDYNNEGGSAVRIAGILSNTGGVAVGSGTNNLDANTTLTVGGLTGTGSVGVHGNYAATPSLATLDVLSAAPGVLTGNTTVDGDALLEYASGQVATIASGVTLLLNGPKAFIADAANTAANSAIAGLAEIDGTLRAINGATVAITGNVMETGFLGLDSDDFNNEGGSAVSITGILTNTGSVAVGSGTNNLDANTTLTIGGLTGTGGVGVHGNYAATPSLATLDVLSAAPGVLTGNTTVDGDALLEYASGQVATIASGVTLLLNGPKAFIADAGSTNTNSAVTGLTEIDGALRLINGDTAALTGNVAVTGFLGVDSDAFTSEGGSSVTIAGTLTNTGQVIVGSPTDGLSAAATLTVGALAGNGSVGVHGSAGATPALATLAVLSAAPGTLMANTTLDGNGLLEYASGQIATISANTTLLLNGPRAFIADASATSANSAIAGLTEIDGALRLINGETAALTGSLLVTGLLGLDSDSFTAEGGSSVTVAGTLTDNGQVGVGPATNGLSSAATLTVGALAGTGSVGVYGNTGISPALAALNVLSAAPGTLTLNASLGGNAVLDYASGQITAIASGVTLSLYGGKALIADAGQATSNSALTGLASNAGSVQLREGVSLATAAGQSFANTGGVSVDAGYQDGGSQLALGGAFANSGATQIGNTALSVSTAVSAASGLNSGTLSLAGGSAGAQAMLTFAGSFTNAGALSVGAYTSLTAAGFTQSTGTTTLAGTLTAGSFTLSGGSLALSGGTVQATAWTIAAGAVLSSTGAIGITAQGQSSLAGGTLIAAAGVLTLGGGSIQAASLSVAAGATLRGRGTIASAAAVAGTIEAQGGTLQVTGAVTGAGTVLIDGNATLELGAATSAAVTFAGTYGTLKLDAPAGGIGVISGFAAGDALDLAGTAATSVSASYSPATGQSTLTVALAGGGTDSFTLAGNYSGNQLTVTQVLGGDSLVTFSPAASQGYTYTPITAFTKTNTIQSSILPSFPTGSFTPQNGFNAPFNIVADGNGHNYYDAGGTLVIPVAIPDATSIYALINAYSPSPGQTLASVEFIGSAGADEVFTLVNGTDVRDYVHNGYANTIDGTTTQNAYTQTIDGKAYVSDEQAFTLDPAFADQTLTTIKFTALGNGTPILLGLTAQSLAAPASIPAQPAITTASPVGFGNVHLGAVASRPLGIANTAASGASSLDVTIGTVAAGLAAAGSIALLQPGATDTADVTVGLDTSADGVKTGQVALNFVSDAGNGATAPLPSQSVTVTGAVYREAAVSASPVNLVVHAGGPVTIPLTVANTAAADGYAENLDASIAAVSGGLTVVSAGAADGIAPGTSSQALSVGALIPSPGVINGFVTLNLASDGGTGAGSIDGLGQTVLAPVTVPVTITVDNYAQATIEEVSGGGTLTQSGVTATLDLGTIATGSGPDTIALDVRNTAAGPADTLSGTLSATGSAAFSASGLGTFAGLAAGQAGTAPTITLDTSQSGTFTETVTLAPAGSNTSGYSAALPVQTLTITGTVVTVPPPTLSAPASLAVFAATPMLIGPITVADPNTLTQPLTVTLSDLAGTLSANASGAGTVSGRGTKQLVLTGSLADLQNELASATYTGAAVGTDTITVSARDQFAAAALSSIAVTTAPVPLTAAVFNQTESDTILLGAQNGLGGLSLSDPSASASNAQVAVTLSTSLGTLGVHGNSGAVITGAGTGSVTLTGTVAQINADLADDGFIDAFVEVPLIGYLVSLDKHAITVTYINFATSGQLNATAPLEPADFVGAIGGPEGKSFALGVTLASYDLNALASLASGGGGPTQQTQDELARDLFIILSDAHIVASDGTIFDFNPTGDYVFATTTQPGDSFTVEVRLEPVGTSSAASQVTQAAALVGTDKVTFAVNRTGVVWVDGAAISLTQGLPYALNGGTVTQLSANTYSVVWNTGEVLTVIDSGNFLNVQVAPGPNETSTSVVGLANLGTDPTGVFLLPDGTQLQQPLTTQQLYQEFAASWAVPSGYSLLDGTPAVPADPNFPETQITLSNLPAAVLAQAAAAVAAAGITDPGVAAAAEFDYIASGGDLTYVMADASVLAGFQTTPAQVTQSGPVAVAIGVIAQQQTVLETGTTATTVTFQVYLTAAATTDTLVNYAAVAAGAGYLTAAAFGGTLPSGTVVIPAGQTSATFAVTVPADALGDLPNEKLAVAVSAAGVATFAGTAQMTIDQAVAGPPPVPVITDLTNLGTFTHTGNAYTLDLGSVQYDEPLPQIDFQISNAATSSAADTLGGTLSAPAADGFTVAGASLPAGLTAGQSYDGLNVTIDYSKFGPNTQTIIFAPTDTNNSGFSQALTGISLTITDTIVTPTMVFSYAYGDVHIITYNGTYFDFQQVGEFTLAQSVIPGDSFDIQLRLQAYGTSQSVSVITQVAISLGTDRITFDVTRSGFVQVDGAPSTLSMADPVLNLAGGTITEVSATVFDVAWVTGEVMTVTSYGVFINVSDGIPLAEPGQVRGLQGEDAGQQSDFQLADGTVLPQPLAASTLYGPFANAWRVSQASSLFDYLPGQTTQTFTNLNFPSNPVTVASLPAAVTQAAAAAVAAAGITDPGLAEGAVLDAVALGNIDAGISSALNVMSQLPVTTVAAITQDIPVVPGLGVEAIPAAVVAAAVGPTTVTFDAYLTVPNPVAVTATYTVVAGGAGTLGAGAFGGTLPSGQVTIAAGATMAPITLSLPQGALGTMPNASIDVQISTAAGNPLFAPQAAALVVNNQTEPGNAAVAALAKRSGPGTLTQSGSAYTLDLGNVLQGASIPAISLALMNIAAQPADALTGTFTAPLGSGFIITGTALGSVLLPGDQYSGIVVSTQSETLGLHTETLTFDGKDVNDSGYSVALPPITLTITDTITAEASAGLNTPGTIVFPNAHIGAVDSQAISISNTAAAPAPGLDVTTVTGGSVTVQGSISELAAGQTNANGIVATLNTATAGLQAGIVQLDPVSDSGTGFTQALTDIQVDVFGGVYRLAAAAITPATTILHVGDAGTVALRVANTATADGYSESLIASLATVTGGLSAAASGPTADIAAGASSAALAVSVSTAAAGIVTGTATLGLASDGGTGAPTLDGLGMTALPNQAVPISITIDNLAQASFEELSGGGTLTRDGNNATLSLGTIMGGSPPVTVGLGVMNPASGPADLLSGTFGIAGGAPFTNAGFAGFTGVSAGSDEQGQSVTLTTGTAGAFTETITLNGVGSNASGYSGALAAQTLTITGTVLQTPGTNPAVSSPSLIVAENAPATAIGIAAPSEAGVAPSQLAITIDTLPTDGVVTLADGVTPVTADQTPTAAQLTGLLFKPAAGLFGASATLTYTVADGNGHASIGAAVLAIGPATGAPTVSSPSLIVQENAAATAIGIATPTDPNYAAAALAITVTAVPSDGAVTLAGGTAPVAVGQALTAAQLAGLQFTPTNGAANVTGSLGYTVTDAAGNMASGTAALAIAPPAGTIAAYSASVQVSENSAATAIGITAPNDSNYPASQLTMTVAALPGDGRVTLADGETVVAVGQTLTAAQLQGLTFTPAPGAFSTSSTLTYAVADPAGSTAMAAAALAIGPAIGKPVLSSPTITATPGSAANPIGIAAPTDPNYLASQLTLTVNALPTDGAVTLADGVTAIAAGTTLTAAQLTGLLFTPAAGASAVSSTLGYSAIDPAGNTASAAATLAVGPAVTGSTPPTPPGPPSAVLTPPASGSPAIKAISNTPTPIVSGTAVAGAAVALTSGNAAVGSAVANAATGSYGTTLTALLPQGNSQITAVATTAAGSSTPSTALAVFEIPVPVSGVSSPDNSSIDFGRLFDAGYQLQFVSGTEAAGLVDGVLSVGPDTTEATIQRLYEGLLGRSNDVSGMTFWDKLLATGISKTQVAADFLNDPEYLAAHGPASAMTDTQFVASLYQSLLGRAATAADTSFWTSDVTLYGRAAVTVGIADSTEAKTTLAPDTAEVWSRNTGGTLIHELYETGLGREVELGNAGLNFWQGTLAAGLTNAQLAQQITVSPEFTSLHAGQSNAAYVASLFQDALGRAPDTAGASFWTGLLQTGAATRSDVLLGVATSSEATANLTRNLAS